MATWLGHVLAGRAEPAGDLLRQGCWPGVGWDDQVRVRVVRECLMKAGEGRAGCSDLRGLLDVEEVRVHNALEAHRDGVDLYLESAVR